LPFRLRTRFLWGAIDAHVNQNVSPKPGRINAEQYHQLHGQMLENDSSLQLY
jgi:hypothetical protein